MFRHPKNSQFSALLFLAGMLASVTIPSAIGKPEGWAVYLDQDLFVPTRNEDRDYTMGLGIELFWAEDKAKAGILDKALDKFNNTFGIKGENNDFRKSFLFGTTTFTPDDLSDPNPIFDDRPYASLFYLSSKRIAISCADGSGNCEPTVLGSEFLVGLIGTDISNTVQTEFHQAYRSISDDDTPVDPQGWNHQISDGGEPVVRYRLSFGRALFSNEYLDIAYTSDMSLGYQTNASIGGQIRLGWLDSGFWSLPYDPINRGSFIPNKEGNEFYLWGAYRARGIGYDALLQGQFRSSNVTFNSNQIERLVHETGFGATWGTRLFQTSLSASYKSAELKTANERSHFWGSLVFICRL